MTTTKKTTNRKNTQQKVDVIGNAMAAFGDMMIEKLESMKQTKWQQPWFTEGAMQLPVNLSGRRYNGMNSIILMLTAEKFGYKTPVWGTFNALTKLNYNSKGERVEDGSVIMVNKGEKSSRVFITTFTGIHKETGEKIPCEQYKELDDTTKEKYNVFPRLNVYNVFCIDQTNMKEARPDLYEKFAGQVDGVRGAEQTKDMFKFDIMENMIQNQSWLCPINLMYQDKAYYSISRDCIVYPTFEQFRDGESFYSSLLHEMAHSTGAKDRLNRFASMNMTDNTSVAKEEMVAELTAAFICSQYGMEKVICADSIPYLQSWLSSIKESPDFIKNVLFDVKKASNMIETTFEKCRKDATVKTA